MIKLHLSDKNIQKLIKIHYFRIHNKVTPTIALVVQQRKGQQIFQL